MQSAEAANYIKALVAMSRMLQKPDVDKILAELDKVKETSLGSLLAFMHAYNLRFAPAKNAAQSAVYASLYPAMAAARDRILASLKDPGAAGTPAAGPRRPPRNQSLLGIDARAPRSGDEHPSNQAVRIAPPRQTRRAANELERPRPGMPIQGRGCFAALAQLSLVRADPGIRGGAARADT